MRAGNHRALPGDRTRVFFGEELTRQTCSGVNRLANYVATYHHFHATVLLASCVIVV
jgi:hypothetical protein